MKNHLNQHKSLAMTGKLSNNMAAGGMMPAPLSGAVTKPTRIPKLQTPGAKGLPLNPMTVAKRNNGVLGMKKGGKSA